MFCHSKRIAYNCIGCSCLIKLQYHHLVLPVTSVCACNVTSFLQSITSFCALYIMCSLKWYYDNKISQLWHLAPVGYTVLLCSLNPIKEKNVYIKDIFSWLRNKSPPLFFSPKYEQKRLLGWISNDKVIMFKRKCTFYFILTYSTFKSGIYHQWDRYPTIE